MGVLAGWLLWHRSSNPQVATPPRQTDTDSIPVAEAVAHSTPAREPLSEVRAEPVLAKHEIRQAVGDLALTSSQSPVISQDLNENRDWARNCPAEALAWLQNAPDGKQRLAIAEIVCSEVAQTNPAAAVTLAENCLGNSTNNVAQYLLDNMAQQWASQDMQAASVWAMAKPPGEERDHLLQHIAFVESKTDPYQAAQLVVQQIPSGPTQNEAAMSVLYQWAQQDAAAALAWAESFPAGDLRDRAIKEVKNVQAVATANTPMN
jgi:hypothetical protein